MCSRHRCRDGPAGRPEENRRSIGTSLRSAPAAGTEMVLNKAQPEVEEKIRAESEASPVARAACAAVEASPEPFEVSAEATGFEVRAGAFLPNGLPNRARMKIFSPKPGHTLVFFYKKSLVPYSRDRYSYGGIDLRTPEVDEAEVAEWLAFISSGFHPEKRPAQLRRAFPYEIPE
jgi:hypothetical protein